MRKIRFLSILLVAMGFVSALFAGSPRADAPGAKTPEKTVLALTLSGAINPAAAEFLSKNIESASANPEKYAMVAILLDTPGGLDQSMRQIVKSIENSAVPVAVYVSPTGSRAASAGAFIMLSAHVAAMAPGTNIGAAHPVSVGGDKMDDTMAEKVENDSAAFIASIAKNHGRNADWAEKAVRESVSIGEQEAVKIGVADFIAADLDDLLTKSDGREISIKGKKGVISVNGAGIEHASMSFRQRILDVISDPNIAYILMMLGMYGLFFELSSPGTILPGVVGAICIILAFYSLQTLPVNYAGLLLILLAVVLFIAEIKITSYGLLTIAGIASLVLGSIMLIDSPDPYLQISIKLIAATAAVTALFFMAIVGAVIRTFARKVTTGGEGMIGQTGTAIGKISQHHIGQVFIAGEYWNAEAAPDSGEIDKDDTVSVTASHGLTLTVKKIGHLE